MPASTWQAVHEGMRVVVTSEDKDIFTKLNSSGIALSGKTGTAQQSQTHPDHGLFVGFAPSDSPQIAFAIRIATATVRHLQLKSVMMSWSTTIKSHRKMN